MVIHSSIGLFSVWITDIDCSEPVKPGLVTLAGFNDRDSICVSFGTCCNGFKPK